MEGGKVIIFSAPSGSGKTTIVQHLLQSMSELAFSVSATTRPIRGSEVHGKDYYFYSTKEFKDLINRQVLVEWEEVYPEKFYGTLKSEVERLWKLNKHVVFDVDVKGGVKIKEYFGNKALAIFVRVPSIQELKVRLTNRKTEDAAAIKERLDKAAYEMTFAPRFDKVIINDRLEDAIAEAKTLIRHFVGKSSVTS